MSARTLAQELQTLTSAAGSVSSAEGAYKDTGFGLKDPGKADDEMYSNYKDVKNTLDAFVDKYGKTYL